MIFAYKTEIAKQFPFPKFEGEKFCPESVVHRRIARKFHILFTDYVLAFGDYLEDGLTKNYFDLLKRNPKSAMLSYREKIWDTETLDQKLQHAKNYWNIANSAKNIGFFEKIMGINLRESFKYFMTTKLIKK